MDTTTESRLREIVRDRMQKQAPQIEHSLHQIAAGNPLGAEPVAARSVARIAQKAKLSLSDATALTTMISRTAKIIDARTMAFHGSNPAVIGTVGTGATVATDRDMHASESMRGPTIDLVGVEFLTRGRLAANAVGRIAFRTGRPQGTGFMVGPGLFLTNNHVIADPAQAAGMIVQFDYEAGDDGMDRAVTSFDFAPDACFVSDPLEALDFTLIAIGARSSGAKPLEAFGYIPLSDAKDKHMLGELANIIQHPQGDLKQVVVRENNLVSRDETVHVLHYLADTDKGSSGSPVCNSNWEPIALHHWGEPSFEVQGVDGKPLFKDVNEGIRISAIVAALRQRVTIYSGSSRERVAGVLDLWDSSVRRGPKPVTGAIATSEADATPLAVFGGPRAQSDGSMTWTFPIEINVRAPLMMNPHPVSPVIPVLPPTPPAPPVRGAEKARKEIDFSDRGGYEPGFIPGFIVSLPDYTGVGYEMAENLQPPKDAEDIHELPYHHFSIFMRADRRLASFTACNIDGRRLAAVDRASKTVNMDPTLTDLGAESSDAFRPDPRVSDDEQMTKEFYDEQEVPGYPKPQKPPADAPDADKREYTKAMNNRTARMYQKGHLTLRGDPAWGTEAEAQAAESDTFFYTNAAPQLGYFNQGSAEKSPASKGKLRWRAIETYVMRNAFTMRQRVSVFAGPIFDDLNDVDYRFESKLPMRFWKLVVWAEKKTLKSIALIGDQRKVLEELTKGSPEAFEDELEIARVSEFLSTVVELEALTGLDFGVLVRNGDVRSGVESMTPAVDVEAKSLLNR